MFLLEKINRLKNSKKFLELIFLYHKIFGEKNIGNIGFDFSQRPSRLKIVKEFDYLLPVKSSTLTEFPNKTSLPKMFELVRLP